MQLRSIQDLLPFLKYLYDNKLWTELDHERGDSLIVAVHMPGIRLEVEFFDDHVNYSIFRGDESVLDDQDALFAMLEEGGK